MAGASAIADGLVTLLSAASMFGSTGVSKDSYQVVETSTCSAVVRFVGLHSEAVGFGRPPDRQRTWQFNIKCYVRDLGDPQSTINRVWLCADKVVSCLESDDTIQGTADRVDNIDVTHNPERAETTGGGTWLTLEVVPNIVEL